MQLFLSVNKPKIQRKYYLLSFLLFCTVGTSLFAQLETDAYISVRYTLPQIVGESTNIVSGTVTEVNTNRKTANFEVEDNLKGKSEFDVIKIRFDIYKGESDHRGELSRFLKQGEPILVCYLQEDRRIDALAHTRGRWFQLQLTKDSQRGWGRWGFTHFEKYLNRDTVSKRDSTIELKKELDSIINGDTIKLLMLNKKSYQGERNVLSGIPNARNRWITWNQTTDRNLRGLRGNDILWLGYRSIDDGRYQLNNSQEKRIRDFVKGGGVVIVSGQDNDEDRKSGVGWLSEPLKGVESNQHNDFKPTSIAGSLFKAPHRIQSGQLSLDDSWNGWNDKFEVLATTNSGKEIVVAKLRYGKGMYLITNLRNDSKENISKNSKMLENLLHYAVDFLD